MQKATETEFRNSAGWHLLDALQRVYRRHWPKTWVVTEAELTEMAVKVRREADQAVLMAESIEANLEEYQRMVADGSFKDHVENLRGKRAEHLRAWVRQNS